MSGYVLHPEAYIDIDDIWEFIAEDHLDAADRVREDIYKLSVNSCRFLIRATCVPTLHHGLCGSSLSAATSSLMLQAKSPCSLWQFCMAGAALG